MGFGYGSIKAMYWKIELKSQVQASAVCDLALVDLPESVEKDALAVILAISFSLGLSLLDPVTLSLWQVSLSLGRQNLI